MGKSPGSKVDSTQFLALSWHKALFTQEISQPFNRSVVYPKTRKPEVNFAVLAITAASFELFDIFIAMTQDKYIAGRSGQTSSFTLPVVNGLIKQEKRVVKRQLLGSILGNFTLRDALVQW